MKKALFALAAVATVAASTVAAPTDAYAQRRWLGPAIVGGIIGAGIVGAYAYPRTYYPVEGYEPYPVYGVAAPYACPGGYWARKPIINPAGMVVGYTAPRFFCPPY
jgi:hypothetical protein